MSVEMAFISLDWSKVSTINGLDDLAGIFEILEEEPDWCRVVDFEPTKYDVLFSSYKKLFMFTEWFYEIRDQLDAGLVMRFMSIFQSVGLLSEEDGACACKITDVDPRDGTWLLGAIPPPDVQSLLLEIQQLDEQLLVAEFQKALDLQPLEGFFDSGEEVKEWTH